MEMAAKDIERLGGTVEMVDIGNQEVKCTGVDIAKDFIFLKKYLRGTFFVSAYACSFPLERRSLCHQLSWAIWGQTLGRRPCVYMGILMSSLPILRMVGIRNLLNWWRKMVRQKLCLLFKLKVSRQYFDLFIKKVIRCRMSQNRRIPIHLVSLCKKRHLFKAITSGFCYSQV